MGLDSTVTRRELVLGSADSVTGWYAMSFSDEDIDMVILPSGSPQMYLLPGAYAREDAVGRTQDAVKVGDQIKSGTRYYVVRSIKPWYLLDSFMYRDCQLSELPFYVEDMVPSATTAGSEAVDPRTRTKDFLDDRLDADYITKDDGSTKAPFITTFGFPPYPLQYVFGSPKFRYVVYAVDEPTSRGQIDPVTFAPYGYENSVPIHILCVDQTDATGTNLCHKARAELRRAVENYPFTSGSSNLRLDDREVSHDRDIGGLKLYDREFTLMYRTDTS